MTRHEIRTRDGHTVVAYDEGGGATALFWHHGSPHTGAPLPPVVALAHEHGLRHITYARPAYGGSTPQPGRTVADAAADVTAILEAFGGIESVVFAGASGGGPHALACAALLGERVRATLVAASPAPFDGTPEWFAGMHSPGALRAASRGPAARAAFTEDFDPEVFTTRDRDVLQSTWSALVTDATEASESYNNGLIADHLAFTTDWGFDPTTITTPVTILQGTDDRMIPAHHAERLATLLPTATLHLHADEGHVSILDALPEALATLLA
ncbi:alpha/beta fold hydrolase [Conexibacter woesei]|uniref:alpha/beta fold hydrolase n=1 Tax=Conexibacter woesei TaxID=191495 RepID=UPI000422C082|nr:alpha/beta hydrolase [Conexibacter woesei]